MMKIKKTGTASLFLALAAMLSSTALFAQSRSEKIRVPADALKPVYSKEYFDDNLKDFKTWLKSLSELPPTGAEFQKRAQEFGEASDSRVSLQLRNMRLLATNPDLEEVTKLPRSWYFRIYNAALPLQTAVKILAGTKVVCVEQKYQLAKKMWEDAVEETLAILEKPPKKLSAEALSAIAAKNKERREKEYIKWYREKQAEEQRKAKEKAAGKTKKGDKPKKKETEE